MRIGPPSRLLVMICAFCVVALAATWTCNAQRKAPAQTAGVDNTPMGVYRALTQLTMEAFMSGDNAKAAELARILERAWDAAEEHGGPKSLVMRNKDLFEQLDRSMDDFIKPIMYHAAKAPDPAVVQAAYDTFLEALKKGE